MLKMTISLDDAAGPWTLTNGTWRCGTSVIKPVQHPALETIRTALDSGLQLTIRERCPGRAGQPHTGDWPGDFITVELGPRTVQLEAGERGVAPLYLSVKSDSLRASWDLADLRHNLTSSRLNAREIARLLTMRFRYGHDTLFADAHTLTERSTAVFTHDGLHMTYPPAAHHSEARELRAEADPVAGYERLLEAAVASRVYDPARTCIELSGGLDSANVGATLGSLHPGQITASAMLLPDEVGIQQAIRRTQLITLLRLGPDAPVSFAGRLPLSPSGRRGSGIPVTPYEDPYDEAKTVLLGQLARDGVRTTFTGIGGDEMVARTAAEFPHPPLGTELKPMPWISKQTLEVSANSEEETAPAAVLNEMTLTAQACAAPAFLRAGIWPVHPLAHPDLITFGEWLPLRWRRHKRLHQARLEALGCPPGLLEPKLRENFTPVIQMAIREHGLPLISRILRSGSQLIDCGFIDPDGLAEVHKRLSDGGDFRERETELYGMIAMDLALRTFA